MSTTANTRPAPPPASDQIFVSDALGKSVLEQLERVRSGEESSGMSTGFRDWDRLSLGIRTGEMTVIAGQESMGKSALALNLLYNMSVENNVAYFTYEMSPMMMYKRLISIETGIDGRKLISAKSLSADEMDKVKNAVNNVITKRKFAFVNFAYANTLKRWCEWLTSAYVGVNTVIFDYLQKIEMKGKFERRDLQIGKILDVITACMKEFDLATIVLSQFSREVKRRGDQRPQLSDLRESGEIEQDADNVILMHSPEFVKRRTSLGTVDHPDTIENEYMDLYFAKQRSGEVGEISLIYDRSTSRFSDGLASKLAKGANEND